METQNGDWYAVFLTGRPLTKLGRCITGRETAIERVEWRDDNWLYLKCGGKSARREVEAPELPEHTFQNMPIKLNFETKEIDINFQALRVPLTPDWVNQTERPGFLRLYGRESLSSCFEQSLIGRRVQEHHTSAETCIEFSPENFQQMAGLVCYYNTVHYHYLHVFGDDFGAYSGKKFLTILTCDDHKTTQPNHKPIEITGVEKLYLKADFNHAQLQFYFAIKEGSWQKIGPVLDGSILSDDYVEHAERHFHPCFTGAFYGLVCQDLSGQKIKADFEYFDYKEITT